MLRSDSRLENGCLITLRTSGTEPKIKYYTELKGSMAESAQKELDAIVKKIIVELIKPEQYAL
jgi:phosphomannomutase